jgi:hypothetical protein
MKTSGIVQKLWNYCNVLRNAGMSYGDYVEQLTYLLFRKMSDERTKAPYNQKSPVPAGYDWPSLIKKDGDERPISLPAKLSGDCGCHGPEARRDRERPGLRHRRLSARGLDTG